MAEKKFFVDINLQGNKLSNAVVGQNTAMTTGGAFQYNANDTRLEYFNGSTTEQVANLSDIQAVTGGLIFQGGYDASTNTPDIKDGTASKGFFWVVTTAGSFLGDSVQIGDSIIAKIDNAGTTLADWIILQGNVVIATETVDGISRLATQTEANAGTESGAVVITPATLQGKIDAQITPEINNKLPLAGGTMSGNILMDGNNIEQINVLSTNILTGNGGDIISGSLDLDGNSISNANLSNNTIFGSKLGDSFDADNNIIINLPAPTNGGDAANKTYVDGVGATAESNANAYTDTAVDALSFSQTIETGDWSLSGGVYTKTITHNLGSYITFTAFYNGEVAEFKGAYANNTLTLTSNTQPSSNTVVNIVKAGGNI